MLPKTTASKITLAIVIVSMLALVFTSAITVSKTHTDVAEYLQRREEIMMALPANLRPAPARIEFLEQFTRNLYTTTITTSFLSIGFALFVGLFVAKHITKPLNQLTQGIKMLQQNKYKITIPVTDTEEFQETIEELNYLAEQLDKAEQLRQELISDISHEMKTPVTSIVGQLQGIMDGVLEPTPERFEVIQDQAQRLSEMVDHMNDYTRIRSLHSNVEKSTVDLKERWKKVVDLFEKEAKDAGIGFDMKFKRGRELINADKHMVERLITNIVENAISYSQGTKITIGSHRNGFYIEDNGVGVDRNQEKKLFERFYRIDKSRNRNTGGLGLGLAIVKEIASAHGWTVKATSGTNGKGLRFFFSFSS
ncbi:HAMP domain-containing histidine kinase [Candidatus Dojkabacteria bacterium]|uniref:histidine kinase n=1 Tax=Candidatus Dojkabacteria bacterium TaxID=2099670 RepID=A0A955RKD6_9BACT|nr:HAMP domain-containing histidine kinase [Candidatus Dojkabacteria bacterium]